MRAAIFTAFADVKQPILEMTRVRASLEDVFLELTSSDAAAIQSEVITETAEDTPSIPEAEDVPEE